MAKAPVAAQRRRLILICLGLVLATVIYVGIERWMSHADERNSQEAATAFFAHDFRRTELLLEQAVQVNPRNLETRRQLAEFYERANPPLALARWREAVALEPERDEVRYALAGCALRLNRPDIAREALLGVSAAGQGGLEFVRLAAGLALLVGDHVALEQNLTRMAQLEPDDLRSRFNLAALRLVSTDPATAAAARQVLVTLAQGGPLSIRATIELMRFAGRVTPPEAGWNRVAQEVLPAAATANWPALLDHMLAQPDPLPTDAAALVSWMNDLGQGDQALAWLAKLDAKTQASPPVRQAQADGVARLGDWIQLQHLVGDGAWGPVSANIATLAFAAHVQHQGAGANHARDTWTDALDQAQTQLTALHVLQRLGGAWDWPEATKDTLWRIAKNFPEETPAWRALIAGAEADSDSTEAWEVALAWSRAQPMRPAAQAHAQWLNVVLNKADPELQNAAGAALTQPAAAPEMLAAGALLMLRAGHATEALQALRPHEAGLANSPRAALVYGNLLALAGEPREAERWLGLAAAAKLLPQEHTLLQQARDLVTPAGGPVPSAGLHL